ncbi:hypothetical protein [Ectopseudomonas toyotomiensis]|uniref:DUF2339 domain-containing protein n=1 Tax=Ectopseudomonas toyotomiensis TaxID=554344 RepID=A0A1I5PBT3_9GAMM|nr:hypothetical protein [Pseudomonas toyotomiensis]SFP31515.1 hypothetical protein SAMN05216177_102235 [Pseudomonas toyotomiensis]
MQWIFMLVGLVLGVGASESVTGALLGGLIGLSLGQALRLQGLETRNAQLTAQLKDFAERFERGTRAMHERLVKVEQGERSEPEPGPVPVPAEPVVDAAPDPLPDPVIAEQPEPELDWTLDPLPEIETPQPVEEPAALAAQVAHQPQPVPQCEGVRGMAQGGSGRKMPGKAGRARMARGVGGLIVPKRREAETGRFLGWWPDFASALASQP